MCEREREKNVCGSHRYKRYIFNINTKNIRKSNKQAVTKWYQHIFICNLELVEKLVSAYILFFFISPPVNLSIVESSFKKLWIIQPSSGTQFNRMIISMKVSFVQCFACSDFWFHYWKYPERWSNDKITILLDLLLRWQNTTKKKSKKNSCHLVVRQSAIELPTNMNPLFAKCVFIN